MSKRFWLLLIAIIVVGFVVWDLTNHNTYNNNNGNVISSNASGTITAPASVVNDLSTVSQSTLDSIGEGTAANVPQAISGPALSQNNKPEIFYEGAEYCPYCATERWAMTVALDRFGSFSNLKLTHSSGTDVYPNTQTLSYYNSTYTSSYISFTPVELYTNIPTSSGAYTTLQTPTNQENTISNKYNSGGSIPFVYFDGKFAITGATYSPTILQGKTTEQIAGSLNNPTSVIAQGVDGAANTITAAICRITNNLPSSACDSAIQTIEAKLK